MGACYRTRDIEDPPPQNLGGRDISMRQQLWSGRASCSAGIELLGHEIIVLGISPRWALAIDHAVMGHAVGIEPIRAFLARLGLLTTGRLNPAPQKRLVAVLAKPEAGTDGRLCSFRPTMLDDFGHCLS